MAGILIIAHAPLASALRDCAAHVYCGQPERLGAIDVLPDAEPAAVLAQARDKLDKSIDREVNKRSSELDKRADALCPKLASLDTLQRQFQFRLQDGSPLQLLTYQHQDNKKLITATDSARAGRGDSAH